MFLFAAQEPCFECYGRGWVLVAYKRETCPRCGGSRVEGFHAASLGGST